MPVPLSALAASYVSGYAQNYFVNKTNSQTAKSPFQQLGQDLQSGNLSQARQDYNVLTQRLAGHRVNSTFSQDFSVLGQALGSGNLSAARQAYSVVQQALQDLGLTLASSNPGQLAGNTVNAIA